MNWPRVAFALSDALSVVLIMRLVMLRLHDIYRVFCAFLIFQVLSESFVIIEKFTSLNNRIDYRITWLVMQLISWILSIWMVYALLNAILRRLPGILRISRNALNVSLGLALAIALVSARPGVPSRRGAHFRVGRFFVFQFSQFRTSQSFVHHA